MTHPNSMHLLTMQRRLRQQALPLIDLFIHVVHVFLALRLNPSFFGIQQQPSIYKEQKLQIN